MRGEKGVGGGEGTDLGWRLGPKRLVVGFDGRGRRPAERRLAPGDLGRVDIYPRPMGVGGGREGWRERPRQQGL